jgi:hypothetical protein
MYSAGEICGFEIVYLGGRILVLLNITFSTGGIDSLGIVDLNGSIGCDL